MILSRLGLSAAWGLFRAWVGLRGAAHKTPDTYRQIAEHEVALDGTPLAPVRLLVVVSGLMLLFGLGLTGCAALRDRAAVVEADRLRAEARQVATELSTLRTQNATYSGSLTVCEAHRAAQDTALQTVAASRTAERTSCLARIERAATDARRSAQRRADAQIERMRNEQHAVDRGDLPRRPVADRLRELAEPVEPAAIADPDPSAGTGAAADIDPGLVY